MHLVFVIPHWMRDPFLSLYGPRIESGVTVVHGGAGLGCGAGVVQLSPQTVPKAVDKSMNNCAKPHPAWCGALCLKNGQKTGRPWLMP
jgi:hypothetical protein